MRNLLTLACFFNLIILTKRKQEQISDVIINDISIIDEKNNLVTCEKHNKIKNSDTSFYLKPIANIDLFDEISADLHESKINFINKKQKNFRILNYDSLLSMFIYNVVMSSNLNLQSDYELLTTVCEDIIKNNYDDIINLTKNKYIEKAIQQIKTIKEIKTVKTIKEILNKEKKPLKKEISDIKKKSFDFIIYQYNNEWIYNYLFNSEYFEDYKFNHLLNKYKFYNNLLYSFFVTEIFYNKLKKIYDITMIENNISYIDIFSAAKIELNRNEGEPFLKLIESSANNKWIHKNNIINKKHILNKVHKNYIVNHELFLNEDINKKTNKYQFISLEKFSIKKYKNYFFSLKNKEFVSFYHISKIFYDSIVRKKVDIVSKQSLQYILKQILEIEDIYNRLVFCLVLFRAIMINDRIKQIMTRTFLLLEIYKQASIEEKNNSLFQANLWYYLIWGLNYRVDSKFKHVYKILKKKFETFINKKSDFNNITNFLEYYSYLLFFLLKNQIELQIKFEALKNNEELPKDSDFIKISKVFLNFILKILFDNNLLKKD